jgi:hypothetical protein
VVLLQCEFANRLLEEFRGFLFKLGYDLMIAHGDNVSETPGFEPIPESTGKSAQFWITHDRTYHNAEFLGENFQLIDTGGLVFDDNDALFAKEIREQVMIAMDEASGVILVIDGQTGLTNMDQELAEFLRKEITRDIPVHVAVNKCEREKNAAVNAAEF